MSKLEVDSPANDRRKRVNNVPELPFGAMEVVDDALLIADREGTIVWANAAFQDLTGYT